MKILIITIATGKYIEFVPNLLKSCDNFFLTNYEKEYLVITDKKIDGGDLTKLHISYQQKFCWPLDTILRFHYFSKEEDLISQFDYVFYIDSDMIFNSTINEDDIIPKDEGLVGVQHPGFYDKNSGTFERNTGSTAYVPPEHNTPYFQGCFFGGSSTRFLEMTNLLKSQIELDFKKNCIAIYHDESHINKFFYQNKPKILNPGFAYPENWNIPFDKKIIHLFKNHEETRK